MAATAERIVEHVVCATMDAAVKVGDSKRVAVYVNTSHHRGAVHVDRWPIVKHWTAAVENRFYEVKHGYILMIIRQAIDDRFANENCNSYGSRAELY
jgi:hypothetical protein